MKHEYTHFQTGATGGFPHWELTQRFALQCSVVPVGDLLCYSYDVVVDGEPYGAAVVSFATDRLQVWRRSVRWYGQTPMPSAELVVEFGSEYIRDGLIEAVAAVIQQRLDGFRTCRPCGKLTAPEHGGEHCQSCLAAEGVVF